jgi:putative pyruvate formate lyase activating enzyme
MTREVAYLDLHRSGDLALRAERARRLLQSCELCPRRCRANRLEDEWGKCRTGPRAIVSSHGPHFGEESPLVGHGGSGTVFFTNCNLACVFCQNFTISQLGEGGEVGAEELAAMMVSLQRRGCHNVNLVTPTHVVPQILEALHLAVSAGLSIPLVYNCGGYESVETLRLLDGIVDIYMPDMKYSDDRIARRYSGVDDYWSMTTAAVKEMHRQVGDLRTDERGVATRGLLVRHLVLPHDLAGTGEVVRFLAEEISRQTYVNIMAQYHPCHRSPEFPLLSRPLIDEEFMRAVDLARRHGLIRLDRLDVPRRARPVLR